MQEQGWGISVVRFKIAGGSLVPDASTLLGGANHRVRTNEDGIAEGVSDFTFSDPQVGAGHQCKPV